MRARSLMVRRRPCAVSNHEPGPSFETPRKRAAPRIEARASQPLPRRLRLHPFEFRQLMPEPGELPLGVVPGVGAADLGGLLQADLALEMPDQRRHAMGLHRRQQRIELSRRQARRPPPARRLAASRRTAHRSAHRAGRGRARETPRGIALAATAAAGRRDASRSASARSPRPPRARGRCGLRSRGFRRSADTGSRRASSACSASTPSRSSRARTPSRISAGIGGTADRPRVSALKYRPEPPTKIGRRFCARASASTSGGIGHPAAGGEIHRGVDMAIEPVRNPRLLFQRRPRGEHAQVAIDLHGIGIDDDAAGFLRKFKRQRRLAAGGRPCDKHRLVVFHLRIRLHVSRRHAHLQSRRPRAR